MGNVGKNYATFNSSVWSHWQGRKKEVKESDVFRERKKERKNEYERESERGKSAFLRLKVIAQ